MQYQDVGGNVDTVKAIIYVYITYMCIDNLSV